VKPKARLAESKARRLESKVNKCSIPSRQTAVQFDRLPRHLQIVEAHLGVVVQHEIDAIAQPLDSRYLPLQTLDDFLRAVAQGALTQFGVPVLRRVEGEDVVAVVDVYRLVGAQSVVGCVPDRKVIIIETGFVGRIQITPDVRTSLKTLEKLLLL
jgi:hypothetical protein